MSEKQNIEIEKVKSAMAQLGYEFVNYYYDNSGCPAPVSGQTINFFNPTTQLIISVSIGDRDDDLMFGEDTREEINKKYPTS